MNYEKLFEFIRIAGMEPRNRIVQPSGTGFASEGGVVSQRLKEFYEARARGGAGLIIVEAATVDFRGREKRGCAACRRR